MDDPEEKFFESLARGAHPIIAKDDDGEGEMEPVVNHKKTSTKKAEKMEKREEELPEEIEDEEKDSDIGGEPEGQLTIDVYQTPNDIVIESAIAGVKPEDIDITVTNDSVAIKGRRHRDTHIKDEDYFYQECYWGRFSRSVILPQEIDADKASVTFKNGVLTVKLPKLNRQKAKKLKVKIE